MIAMHVDEEIQENMLKMIKRFNKLIPWDIIEFNIFLPLIKFMDHIDDGF